MSAQQPPAHFVRIASGLILTLLATVSLTAGQSSNPAAARTTLTSTLNDQQEVAVTVYNQNQALVRDARRLDLPTGELDLRFMDIAARVNPATVHIASQTAPQDLAVLEQNYEYDLLNPQKLLEKYVGREVTLVRSRLENNTQQEVEIKATLLANNESGPVWQVGNQIETGIPGAHYIFPDLPPNLYSKPTLIWLLTNGHAGQQTVEASYLTSDMNWNADYVVTVASTEKTAALNGWVTVSNNSGTEFRNAQLQLVAGAVNVAPAPRFSGVIGGIASAPPRPAPQFVQENISEYHLYSLERRTTVQNNESKQISLLEAASFPIQKHYEVSGESYYYRDVIQPGEPIKNPVEVHLKFKNSRANSLGMPLPAGTMRVYQADSKGRLQFIGEDRIDHTPKDENIDLHIGNAFDLVAERKQTDYQKIDRRTAEMAFEITLRNHKSEPVTIEVNEPIGGDWTMEQSSFKYEKTSAFSARFTVPVPPNGEAVLTYRVRVRW